MALTFEWDEDKDLSNRKKHGVGFDEAKTVFNDPRSLTIADEVHSEEEERYIDIGVSASGRLICRFVHRARIESSHYQLP